MAQVLKLKPAFNDQQAEALAGLFDEELATKRDLEALRLNVDAVKAELKADIEKLRLEVQRDLKGTEARLVIWVVGQGAATIGILFALQHFIGK
ncbi:hypothetical protein [Sphingomonas bacterium]|uniref:hypothetical protein n=1 Tax=Sphingomonas bacterium TaxID=1895847 RepID=UPI0015754EEB|nr:hypothetical protein [Sphingomonas bacterium]